MMLSVRSVASSVERPQHCHFDWAVDPSSPEPADQRVEADRYLQGRLVLGLAGFGSDLGEEPHQRLVQFARFLWLVSGEIVRLANVRS